MVAQSKYRKSHSGSLLVFIDTPEPTEAETPSSTPAERKRTRTYDEIHGEGALAAEMARREKISAENREKKRQEEAKSKEMQEQTQKYYQEAEERRKKEEAEQKAQREKENAEWEEQVKRRAKFRVGSRFENVIPLCEVGGNAQATRDVIPRLAKTTPGNGLLSLLVGPPGSGKSTLLRAAVSARYHGRPFLGVEQEPDRSPVLWLTEESIDLWDDYSLREALPPDDTIRLGSLDSAVRDADPADQYLVWCEWLRDLREMIRREGITLVIADTMMGTMPPVRENEYAEMIRWMGGWRDMTRCRYNYGETNPAVVLSHHATKKGGSLGSVAIPANTDLRFELSKPDLRGTRRSRTVHQTGRFGTSVWSYSLRPDEDGHYDVRLIERKNEPTEPKLDADPLIADIIAVLKSRGPLDRDEIRKAVKKNQGVVVAALKDAMSKGLVYRDDKKFKLTKAANG